MKFEVSERVKTRKTQPEMLDVLEEQFKKVAERVQREGQGIVVESVEAGFVAVRADRTIVRVIQKENGCLCVAEVNYRPSGWFWIEIFCLLFTGVLWIAPIISFAVQKGKVKEAVQNVLKRVRDETES